MKSSVVFPLSLVVTFLASCLIPACKSDACDDLTKCAEDVYIGPKGIWSFLYLKTKITSQAQWDQVWMNICNSIQDTTKCLENKACTQKQARLTAMEANLTASGMCTPYNQYYYRELWQSEPECIGNPTLIDRVERNAKNCSQANNIGQIDSMDKASKCRALSQYKKCEIKFFTANCGDIIFWMIGFALSIIVRVSYNECYDEMYPYGY
ncbi:hypothetical protein RRG08_017529 [Elysia crispata]|uniref:Uncharacterized protein n=1 Tax=Elysia crispata TaxID=231223 RepID=A0AAE1B1W8_9GAST|nr:hypothetical protein RRG08_017529 [Elysia crispata]